MAGQRGKPLLRGKHIVFECCAFLLVFFGSGQGGNAANSCFSAAGKNENALFICAPSIMNRASAEVGGGKWPRYEVYVQVKSFAASGYTLHISSALFDLQDVGMSL